MDRPGESAGRAGPGTRAEHRWQRPAAPGTLTGILYRRGTVERRFFFKSSREKPIKFPKPPAVSNRAVKTRYYREASPPPEALILGNSAAFKYAPATVERLTNLRAFNGAVRGGEPHYFLAFTRMALERHAPRLIFAGVHANSFIYAPHFLDGLRNSPLGPYVGLHRTSNDRWTGFRKEARKKALRGLGWVIRHFSSRGRWRLPMRFDRDGLAHFRYEERVFSPGREPERIPHVARYLQHFQEPRPLDAAQCQAFETWLALCQAHRIRTIVLLAPWHPFLLNLLYERTRFSETQDQIVEYLAKLQSTYGFTFFDFTRLETFGGHVDDYFDSRHFSHLAADRILEQIL